MTFRAPSSKRSDFPHFPSSFPPKWFLHYKLDSTLPTLPKIRLCSSSSSLLPSSVPSSGSVCVSPTKHPCPSPLHSLFHPFLQVRLEPPGTVRFSDEKEMSVTRQRLPKPFLDALTDLLPLRRRSAPLLSPKRYDDSPLPTSDWGFLPASSPPSFKYSYILCPSPFRVQQTLRPSPQGRCSCFPSVSSSRSTDLVYVVRQVALFVYSLWVVHAPAKDESFTS